jgi:methionyl-tRNA formyltransferase
MVRIVFMGSPAFALPTLKMLLEKKRPPIAVYAQPDREAGRGRKLTAPAVKVFAQEHSLNILQPERFDDDAIAQLRELNADIAVVIAYGKILKKPVIEAPKFGCVNLHASLLPALRGAAPIARAIMNGDRESGITLQKIDEGLDTGDIILKRALAIAPLETGGALTERLALLAADVLDAFFQSWNGTSPIKGTPQGAGATYAPKILSADRVLHWEQPARQVLQHILALSPEPGAQAFTPEREPFQILSAALARPSRSGPAQPGTIVSEGSRVFVQCGASHDWIEILQLKPPGSKAMSAADFARGRKVPATFVALAFR